MSKILILPGDYIGPEIIAQARLVLECVMARYKLDLQLEEGLLGGAALDVHGVPLPEDTLAKARQADAILLGAVGGPKWDNVDRALRPEKGLLQIRSELQLFGNLRPAQLYPQLASASSLKPEIVSGLDILFALSAGIESLMGVQNLTGLSALYLRDNSITDISAVSGSSKWPAVRCSSAPRNPCRGPRFGNPSARESGAAAESWSAGPES